MAAADNTGTGPNVSAAQSERLIEAAPGAIPATGGVPPQDAGEPVGPVAEGNSIDELADGLDLLLRASRRLLPEPNADLESAGQRALQRLQRLGDRAVAAPDGGRGDRERVMAMNGDFGNQVAELTRRLVARIEKL